MAATFKVIRYSLGGTVRDMYTGLTYDDAYAICEDFGWSVCPDGGYEWDLDIEEE
jgi:hypothetical protein